MEGWEELEQELKRRGKTGALRQLAASGDARRLAERMDGAKAREALRRGDGASLSALLQQVLTSEEGRRLARQVEDMMKK